MDGMKGRLSGAAQLGEESGYRITAELRGMKRGWREAAEGVGNLLWRDMAGFGDQLSRQHLREDRACGDGRHASLGLEARRADAAAIHEHRHPEYISANRIGHLDRGVGASQIP